MELTAIPWVLAFLTALWFGLQARSVNRNAFAWALTGFLVGLVASTIVFGVWHAAAIPFSDAQRHWFHLKWTGVAVLVIAFVGWLVTMPLHRHYTVVWYRLRPPPPGAAGVAPAK